MNMLRRVTTQRDRREGTRRARQRGAVMVEAAFVFPIMVLVTYGVVELGMAFNSATTVASSSRSGARLASSQFAGAPDKGVAADRISQAVRLDVSSISPGEPIEMWIFRANSARPSTCTSGNRCYLYTWNTTTKNWNTRTGGWTDPDGCGDTIDSVGVYVRARHPFITRVFGAEKIITQQTIMRLEPLQTDQCS